MDRFDAMRLFIRIVERRSFTAAAADLGLPRSTATEVMKLLEARLGARLLQRTTRVVSPTLDGQAYYNRVRRILAEVEEAESAFRGTSPKGLLRVDVHGTLARHFVLPSLPDFLSRHPGLHLQISESDRLVDLVREGIDCVLRVGNLSNSAMVARRVAMLDEATVASPDYLARRGTPRSVGELSDHLAVGFISSASGAALPFEFVEDGEVRHMAMLSVVSVTAAESLIAAARLGLGLIQAPRYHLRDDLASGRLVAVLESRAPTPTPVSLLYPHSRQLSPRVRVFVDWVAGLFAADRVD